MKGLTNLIDKVGVDKALHFAVGAALDAMLYPFGIEYTLMGIVVVFMLSCVKETIDSFEDGNRCDWNDVLASILGAACMCIYYNIV